MSRGAESAAPPSDIEIAGYTLLHLLGEGGMGRVYVARDNELGRLVAIKVISEDRLADELARTRFLREARTMATVEHPHVVRVYAYGEMRGRPYLVMEYVDGETLGRRLWEETHLTLADALRITEECVDALQAVWRHGIVHRDIKPSNILIDENDTVRVADFGLAKPVADSDGITMPRAGAVLGTPFYASPEQLAGREPLDLRSDIYSLGIVLFEMLTGVRPFTGSTPEEVVRHALETPLPDLRAQRPEVPESVAGLIEWMTRKRRERRPAAYADLRRRLRDLRGDRPEDEAREPTFAETLRTLPASLSLESTP
ncbi:MAG: serine/threonine protein kinase, partial [Acidobacteriota bacterium]